jgi:hypothetical protein
MAKKSENKQIQLSKQNINITIGDKAVKRKRRRRKQSTAKGRSDVIFQPAFTTPVINYPPNYNPAAVQPLQQQQSTSLVPKVPAGVPPAKQPRGYAAFPEGETAPLLGLGTDPVKFEFGKNEPVQGEFSKRLKEASKKEDNVIGGKDTNLGDQYEPDYGGFVRKPGESIDPLTSRLGQGIARQAYGSWKSLYEKGLTTGQQRRQPLPPINIRPPDYPPPLSGLPEEEYISSRRGRPKGSKNRPKGAGKEFPSRSQEFPVEPLGEPPEEGIRFLGSSTAPAEAPPSLERQRGEGITPIEATFLSS